MAGAHAAQPINWYSPVPLPNRTSSGAAMDGSFQFQLGAFSNGFVPTAANIADWAANWSPANSVTYQPVSHLGVYESNFLLTGNLPPFSVGAKAYVWGRSQGSANEEWIMFRATDWTWPSANPPGAPPGPLYWDVADANEIILGTVHPSGTPFLMQSAAILTYQQWKSQILAGEALDAPNDDPDHDGVRNLLEFLFGTSPTQAGSPPATPMVLAEVSGQKYLQITIPRLRDRLVSLTVEVSSDLVSWQSGTAATVDVSNTSAQWVVRDLTPLAPGLPSRFMRMKAVIRP